MTWPVAILISGFFFSLNHIIRKKILEDANVLDMMIFTGGFGFLVMLPFVTYVDFTISYMNLFLIMLNTAFAYAGSYTLNSVYKHCEISSVSPMLNINPLFVILLSHITLGEVLSGLQFFGIVLILTGGYLITLEDIRYFYRPFTSIPKKYFWGILTTLVLWSFCPVLNRVVLLEIDTLSYLFFFTMFIFIIQVVLLISCSRYKTVAILAKKKCHLLILASLCWVISDLLHLYAIAMPACNGFADHTCKTDFKPSHRSCWGNVF
jgi:drug/metabolite transporter (DMT)-like permease